MHERTPSPDQAERLRKLVIPPKSVPEHAVGLSVSPVSAIDRTRSSRIARAIAISSGKGGVGKTNLAVNLAVAFAARVSARSQESCQAREKSLALIMIRFVMQLMSLIGLIAPRTFTSERARELADRPRGWRIG